MILDLLQSLSSSVAGFIVGWLVGREMLFISQIREATVPEEERERTDQQLPRLAGNRLLGWIVVVLALFTVVQGSYYAYSTNQTSQQANARSECQAQYNKDFATVAEKRAQWAAEDKQALQKMLSDLLTAKPPTGRQILTDYLAATARTDKLRAQNPLPNLDERNC